MFYRKYLLEKFQRAGNGMLPRCDGSAVLTIRCSIFSKSSDKKNLFSPWFMHTLHPPLGIIFEIIQAQNHVRFVQRVLRTSDNY